MCEICVNKESELSVNAYRYDPTRTTVLRNMYASESNKRFDKLTNKIKTHIIEKQLQVFQEIPFKFSLDAKKIEEFTRWLEWQINQGLLDNWPNKYITNAYKKGISRALVEMRKANYKVPTLSEIGGVEIPLTLSTHVNTLELLYLRNLSDLKGITFQMEQVIVRVLAESFIKGDSYALMADKIVAIINGSNLGELGLTDSLGRFIPARRRAELLARTEIVRAHHLAMIQEFRRWGVEGVTVLAEFQTAGDERVCIKCASMEGNLYTLDAAEGIIPVHPLCRCIIIPIKLAKR